MGLLNMSKLPISLVTIISSPLESAALVLLRLGHMLWGERSTVGNGGNSLLDDRVEEELPCSQLRCILTASAYETFLDDLIFKTCSFCLHHGQLLAFAACLSWQFGQLSVVDRHTFQLCSAPHLEQRSLPLQWFTTWPNRLHLKHCSGLGTYGLMLKFNYPILTSDRRSDWKWRRTVVESSNSNSPAGLYWNPYTNFTCGCK